MIEMGENDLINAYANAAYIQGYVKARYPDDDHLQEWCDRSVAGVRECLETRCPECGGFLVPLVSGGEVIEWYCDRCTYSSKQE